MKNRPLAGFASPGSRSADRSGAPPAAHEWLDQVVDAGLIATLWAAPFCFGGRHDFGRLVLVVCIVVTSVAWFVRQSLRPTTPWRDSAIYSVLLLAIGLVAAQVVPLPADWVDRIAPRNAELLTLWHADGMGPASLGKWTTLSLIPHESTKALALWLAYVLLFVVVVQRIRDLADVQRVLRWIGVSAMLMAAFGLLQYFAGNGKFFWFYEHPYRDTDAVVCGSFMNRNHFANFLVMGVGPLVAWLLQSLRDNAQQASKGRKAANHGFSLETMAVGAGICLVLFAVLLSQSRGAAVSLAVSLVALGLIYLHGRLVDAKHVGAMLTLAVVLLGLLSAYGYESVSRRLSSLGEGSLESVDRAAGRRKIWTANITAFQQGGLVGSGIGSHRMIYPVYLPESIPLEFTHAESSYLQIASEAGFVGAGLLLAGLGICGSWCWRCLQQANDDTSRLLFGAAAAGLVASGVHAIVDFVWHIPACVSIALVLAACVLRLAQLTQNQPFATTSADDRRTSLPTSWSYGLCASAVASLGAFMIWTYVGPGVAAVHWDRYLCVSAAKSRLAHDSLNNLVVHGDESASAVGDRRAMSQAMLRHLQKVLEWEPESARANLRMAAHLLGDFELHQLSSSNPMDISQIREAAMGSQFKSPQELQNWLSRAFGEDHAMLYDALKYAHAGIAECPLQGEGYLRLADLCFLEGGQRPQVDAYVQQALRVRPHDGDVLYEAGKQRLIAGDMPGALAHWTKCFRDEGPHQLRIVHLLAGRIPAALFLQTFQPDWDTLLPLWRRYQRMGQPQDLEQLVEYAHSVTQGLTPETAGNRLALIWSWQATMYGDIGRNAEAVACLEKAYGFDSRNYDVRYQLGQELVKTGRHAEAEAHLRWCLSRHPENKVISNLLVEVSKSRSAQLAEKDVSLRR